MPIELTISVLSASVFTLVFVLYKIKKSKLEISDAIFWVITPLIMIILSIFPGISFTLAGLLGIISPVNFLVLVFIAICLLKLFLLTIKISKLKEQNKILAQKIAFDVYEREKQKEALINKEE